jgi:predicted short-subunit dehydrogenase-like oxidoreductase (DUF2520 family)
MNSKKVVIIGGGNVAYHLIRSITSSGHKLVQVYNRTPSKIVNASSGVNLVNQVHGITLEADIYIICVKDTAIAEVAISLRLKDKLVVHTSGNRSMDLLSEVSSRIGVFYPIQSFTKEIPIQFKKTPIIIEANTADALKELELFAKSISNVVERMDELSRQKLNVAGVFANNFTNHLFTLINDYLKNENIDFKILLPLIQNTVDKLSLGSPHEMQTGPAVRSDMATIQNHLEILYSNPEMKEIYQTMTHKIRSYHTK